MLKQWRFWLSLAITILFLVLALRGQNPGEVWRALEAADYRFLPLALALYFCGVAVRAVRWQALLKPLRRLHFRSLFPVIVIGYMANNVLPWRIGEFVRAYILREREGIPTSASLATIAVERIFDGLTMLLFLLVASLVIPLDEQVGRLALVATVIFGVGLVLLALIVLSERLRGRLLGLLTGPLPEPIVTRLLALVDSFVTGLLALRSGRDLAVVGVSSLAAWGLESSMYLILARSFRLPLGLAGALMAAAVANLATLLPSTPGYIGVFEYGIGLVVHGLLGIDRERTLSYAIVLHAVLYLPITLWGIYYWLRGHLSLRAIQTRMRGTSTIAPATGRVEGVQQ